MLSFFRSATQWVGSRWRALLAALGALLAVVAAVVVRRRSRPSIPAADAARAGRIVEDAVWEERARGAKAREAARQAAQAAHASESRGHAQSKAVRDMAAHEREAAVRRIKEKLRKSGPLLLLAALPLVAQPVMAAEPVESAVHEDGSSLAAGWWMDDAEHSETSAWLAELEGLRAAAHHWKSASVAYEAGADRDAAAVSLCTAVQRATERDLRVRDGEVEQLRREVDRWYRRPGLMIGLGFGLGVVVSGLIVWGAK